MMMETPPSDDVCPICYNVFYVPCMTNCGHWFCGNCILLCWKHRPSIKQCKCPICSQPVSKLIPEASAFSKSSDESLEIYKNIQQYNRLYGGGIRRLLLVRDYSENVADFARFAPVSPENSSSVARY
ncbi:hypothetical protein Leryth_019425 [Lithospermum erythrorhizon]|nr:hypothetical protein Leryth_019425 [Lithospermum erythrorhizon]